MKGILFKSELYDGWLVRWSNPEEYRQPIHEIQLHPDDVQIIIEASDIFDNVEARYHNQVVEFEIITKQKMDGFVRYAKIVDHPYPELDGTLNLTEDIIKKRKLSEGDSQIFLEAIMNPKEPNEELKKLAEEYTNLSENNLTLGTVGELIDRLKKFDPDTKVMVNGYEGGYDTVTHLEVKKVVLNYYDEWYYGKHEDAETINKNKELANSKNITINAVIIN